MLILRKITKRDAVQINIELGDSYTLIHSEWNKEKFIEHKKEFNSDDECYAVIYYNNGNDFIELFKKQWNYIMTGDGSTFSNLTYK